MSKPNLTLTDIINNKSPGITSSIFVRRPVENVKINADSKIKELDFIYQSVLATFYLNKKILATLASLIIVEKQNNKIAMNVIREFKPEEIKKAIEIVSFPQKCFNQHEVNVLQVFDIEKSNQEAIEKWPDI